MGPGERGALVDQLLDRAVAAINRGDQATAATLAGQVLALDRGNPEAEDMLAAPASGGEIRRLTILFVDLVDSTVLSTTLEPETYRTIVGRYRDLVGAIMDRYEGHISSTKGDGLLAVFGHPAAHEDDARRAVLAALEISRQVARLSEQAKRRFGVGIAARVGVHRGLVYLDTTQDDVYGMAANLAQRVSGLAPPGAVVLSDAVAPLLDDEFELEARSPVAVKGVETPIAYHLVLGERADAARVGVGRGPLLGRERELARLQKSWRRAQQGTLRTPGVAFRGEPGIGKSRLAAAAAELVEGSGAVVLELTGSPFHTDAGLHPVRTLLERRCGITRLTDPAERLRLLEAEVTARSLDPVRVVPLLAPVLGIPAEAGYTPVTAEGRKLYDLVAGAVQEYLLACLGGKAGLLLAKDVQWFDPTTEEVLARLFEAGQGRLLVVITVQEGTWLPPCWPVKVFDLQPLTDEQADQLISALNPRLSAAEHAAVRERCDGIPFYIEQLVGAVGDKRGQTEVPDALYEPLLARLRASANVVPVVEAAAIIADRDRREIGLRLERGFLAAAIEGNQTPAAVGDFERCLQLGGTDLHDDELVATMVAPDGLLLHPRRPAPRGPRAGVAARRPRTGTAVVASCNRGLVRCSGVASRRVRCRQLTPRTRHAGADRG